jgi:hypothetical protein
MNEQTNPIETVVFKVLGRYPAEYVHVPVAEVWDHADNNPTHELSNCILADGTTTYAKAWWPSVNGRMCAFGAGAAGNYDRRTRNEG